MTIGFPQLINALQDALKDGKLCYIWAIFYFFSSTYFYVGDDLLSLLSPLIPETATNINSQPVSVSLMTGN